MHQAPCPWKPFHFPPVISNVLGLSQIPEGTYRGSPVTQSPMASYFSLEPHVRINPKVTFQGEEPSHIGSPKMKTTYLSVFTLAPPSPSWDPRGAFLKCQSDHVKLFVPHFRPIPWLLFATPDLVSAFKTPASLHHFLPYLSPAGPQQGYISMKLLRCPWSWI